MDGERFDAVTRALGAGAVRRRVLAGQAAQPAARPVPRGLRRLPADVQCRGGPDCACLDRASGEGSCCGLSRQDGKSCSTFPYPKCPNGDADCLAGSFCGPRCDNSVPTCFPACGGA